MAVSARWLTDVLLFGEWLVGFSWPRHLASGSVRRLVQCGGQMQRRPEENPINQCDDHHSLRHPCPPTDCAALSAYLGGLQCAEMSANMTDKAICCYILLLPTTARKCCVSCCLPMINPYVKVGVSRSDLSLTRPRANRLTRRVLR